MVGPTGVGKSTFLYWWARSVMEQGYGLLVLDPKGDLVEALLAAVPPGRVEDTILLDFADTEWPVALNPLDVRDAAEGERVAGAVYTMMKELVKGEDLHWGTSMSQAFAYGFRTLAANPQIKPSMLDLERLFFDRDWRQTLLPQVTDPFLRSYWQNQVDRTSTRQFELTFGGALRRMAMLVQDPRVRNILVQPRSAVGWDGALADRKYRAGQPGPGGYGAGRRGFAATGQHPGDAVLAGGAPKRPADMSVHPSSPCSTSSRSSWTPGGTWRRSSSARAATEWG